MEDFVAEIVAPQDEHIAALLSVSLKGRGAFRRFKDTLHEHADSWMQAWYQWKDAHLEETVDEWVKSLAEEFPHSSPPE